MPPGEPQRIVIGERGLDVNNAVVPGEAGFETGTGGTLIYGFVTLIDGNGIALFAGDQLAYSGMPVVRNAIIDLVDVRAPHPIFKQFLTASGFETAMESGINRALRANGVVPVSLSLGNGVLVIVVEPSPSGPEVG